MPDLLLHVSQSDGFNKDGVPKRPKTALAYSENWYPSSISLEQLMMDAGEGKPFSPATYIDQERCGANAIAIGVMTAEYDVVKLATDKTQVDWEATKLAVPTIEMVRALVEAGIIDAFYASQSGRADLGAGRFIKMISRPMTEVEKYRAASEVFHQDIEEFTGLPMTDRCGRDVARWWAGTNDPAKLIACNTEGTPLDTDELLARADELMAAEPFKYQTQRKDTPAERQSLSKQVVRTINWIFNEALPPPDSNSYQNIVSPAKALARLYSPLFDEVFCDWISSSQYRLNTIGGSAERFLYAGGGFNCASVGWFIRAVDKEVPDWRADFEAQFGFKPGLNDFNPQRKLALISEDF